jgi:hypothetical protein
MLYFYSLNQGQRTDGTQFRSIIATDKPVAQTKTVSIGTQSAGAGANLRAVKYGAFNPQDDNGQQLSADNPWWDSFIEDFSIDMENPTRSTERFKTYQGSFGILSEDLELSDTNVVKSDGTTADNLYYVKTK